MKKLATLLFLALSLILFCQKKKPTSKKIVKAKTTVNKAVPKISDDLKKLNDSVADLIPKKIEGKFGFINQSGKLIIKPEYSNVGFFTEDCNLLNSPNENVRKFGTNKYASVRLNNIDYRINKAGKRVYRFIETDRGTCQSKFVEQLFHAYILNSNY